MRTHRYSVKQIGFSVPPVPGPYKIHSITPTLLYLSHKIVHHRWSSQQLDIVIALDKYA